MGATIAHNAHGLDAGDKQEHRTTETERESERQRQTDRDRRQDSDERKSLNLLAARLGYEQLVVWRSSMVKELRNGKKRVERLGLTARTKKPAAPQKRLALDPNEP